MGTKSDLLWGGNVPNIVVPVVCYAISHDSVRCASVGLL